VEAGTKLKETSVLERGLRAIRWDKNGNHRTAKRRMREKEGFESKIFFTV